MAHYVSDQKPDKDNLHQMAYKAFSKDPVSALAKEYKSLAEAVKKAPLLKKKEAEKALDAKGLQIKTLLKQDFDGIRTNFNFHGTSVEKAKVASDAALRAAKEAYANCTTKGPNQTDKDKIANALNTATIKHEEPSQDAHAFGKAWADHRAVNPVGLGVDKKYIEEFSNVRSKLMAEGKPTTLKIDQMKQNVTQIETIARQFLTAGIQSLAEAQTEAKDLDTRIAGLLDNMKNIKSFGEGAFESSLGSVTGAPTNKSVKKTDIPVVVSAYQNLVAITNMWKGKVKTMKDAYTVGVSTFSTTEKKDSKIKSSLEAAASSVEQAEKLLLRATQQLPIAAKALQTLQEKFK